MEALMDFDRAPAPERPSASHLTSATERALEVALRSDGGTHGLDLQPAIRDVCAEARRQGLRAEELIVLFKRAWHGRPELKTLSREETGRRLESVITMCVEEYYGGAR
jgi:hypothetical protein